MQKMCYALKSALHMVAYRRTGFCDVGYNESNITTDVLVKICEYRKCDIADIVEIVPDELSEEEN